MRGPIARRKASGSRGIDEGCRDTEARQRVVEHVVAAAVDRTRRDNVISAPHEGGDRQMERRLATCGGCCADTALKAGDCVPRRRKRSD